MLARDAAYTISVGRPSPWPTPISQGAAATLIADAAVPILVIAIVEPSPDDIDIIKTGRVDVALDREGTSAFFVWQFTPTTGPKPSLLLDTALHVGLEKVRQFPNLSTRGLAPGEERGATVVLQDGLGIVLTTRLIVMPRPILEWLAPVLTEQLAARGYRKLKRAHRENIRRYYGRMPDRQRAYDLAPIKAWAS